MNEMYIGLILLGAVILSLVALIIALCMVRRAFRKGIKWAENNQTQAYMAVENRLNVEIRHQVYTNISEPLDLYTLRQVLTMVEDLKSR